MDTFIYIICLGVGLVFSLLSVIFGHLMGGGHEAHVEGCGGHAEAGGDSSGMPGVSPFSPTVIACFVTSFGGLGIIFKQIPATSSAWLGAPLALLGAVVISFAMLWVLRQLFRHTQSSSEAKVADLVGMPAQVITPMSSRGHATRRRLAKPAECRSSMEKPSLSSELPGPSFTLRKFDQI
jgi:hypothetical protein